MRLGRPASLSALLFVLFGTVTAVPLNLRAQEPCEKVQQQVDKWFKVNPVVPAKYPYPFFASIYPPIPAAPIKPSLAYACLKSVPLDVEAAIQQLDYLRPVFQWHSTLDYLKNPPREYLSQGLDLMAGMEEIADNVRGTGTKLYANEFEFLADLYTLTMVRVRDGHFSYFSLLFDLFSFNSGVEFVSISKDGLSIPEIFLRDDVDNLDHGYTPSPLSTINGVPALDYMREASLRSGGAHDPDARFNTLFSSLSKDGNLLYVPAPIDFLNLEDHTKVKLQNGTVLKFDNTAYVRGNFTGITSGRDVYDSFGRGNGTGPAPFAGLMYEMYNKNFTPTRVGYPDPVVESDMGGVRGFLPTSDEIPELNDVAVLSINTFAELPSPWSIDLTNYNPEADYRNTSIALIQAAKAAGREKLILDLQSNYGGLASMLYTLYLALFPQETVFPLLNQFRAHPQFEFLLEYAKSNRSTRENQSLRLPWYSETSNTSTYLKPDGSAWPSADIYEFYGPVEHRSPDDGSSLGSYTHASQWDPAYIRTAVRAPWTEPPFHPDNITILTDGECASACAILVGMLTHKHGIRTVTVGGRPLNQPMQAVGMVKGGPTFAPAGSLIDLVEEIHANETVQVPDGVELISSKPPPLRSVPSASGIGTGGETIQVNLGNMVPWDGDVANVKEQEVPSQFRYEAANCKVFWTWGMMKDMRALWGKVAQVSWAGRRCVEGSSTGEGGRIGAETVGYSDEVRGDGWI